MSVLTQTASLLYHETTRHEDKYDHEIQLVDHSKPLEEQEGGELSNAPTATEGETPISPSASSPLAQIFSHGSIREELTKRKFRKWQEDRVVDAPAPPDKPADIQEEETPPAEESPASPVQKLLSKRETLRTKRDEVKDTLKEAIRGPRLKHQPTRALSVFDILYENQRGAFFFGLPMFSGKGLLNFDPPPWQTAGFHPSPVDITNAQLPDPSWAWAEDWKHWYVDMSGDVDEEGWTYSFAFGQRGRFAWHGTHPWFHSFVRRRRWLRLRVNKGHLLSGAAKSMHEAHMLNPDYFTIHKANRDPSPGGDSYTLNSKRQSAATSKRWSAMGEEEVLPEDLEIKDIATLLQRLRKAAIDREKIAAVRTFLQQGGDELYYLADNMHEIMSLLVFQSSRRQLLSLLMKNYEKAVEQQKKDHKEKRKEKETSDGGTDQGGVEKRVDNLKRAIQAADEECKRLEYWSDIRDAVKDGDITGAADETEKWGKEWQGIDRSGAESRDAMSPCDSDDDEVNTAPVGKTTMFADDVDDGKGPEYDGTKEEGSKEEGSKKPEDKEVEASHNDESPSAEELKSPDEEHPYDPDVADTHDEPGQASESQELRKQQSSPSLKEESRPKSWIEQAWG